MGDEALRSEIRSGLEIFKELADGVEVVGVGELGDGDGEGDPVEVGLRRERGGLADVDDAEGVFLGLDEAEGGSGFLLGGEGLGVRREEGGESAVGERGLPETRDQRHGEKWTGKIWEARVLQREKISGKKKKKKKRSGELLRGLWGFRVGFCCV